MIRRPPRSTLFPYTRSSDLEVASAHRAVGTVDVHRNTSLRGRLAAAGESYHFVQKIGRSVGNRQRIPARSEEHTSELQSPCNLVCRLLLEKKKKKAKVEHQL